MGTSAERSSSNTEYFTRRDKIPGIQANGMDIIASAQAVKYARDWVIAGKVPLLLEFVMYRYGGHLCVLLLYKETNTNNKSRMADPGTTYHTREEVQCMRPMQDPIRGLQHNNEK
jgi:pyruvate dehydrogenase E1 component alpha subunit